MVHCGIEHKKVPNSRPLLTMLSRSASTLSPKATPRHSKNIVSTKQSSEGELGTLKSLISTVLSNVLVNIFQENLY